MLVGFYLYCTVSVYSEKNKVISNKSNYSNWFTMAEIQQQALPPGWDCKYDPRSSRFYFINHYTKVTTWDDPRLKYRTPTQHVEHIPLQHGSPEFRRNYVYPSQICPQPAFQMPKNVPVQDLSNISRMSPVSVTTSRSSAATANNNNNKYSPIYSQVVSRMQETSLSQSAVDTEQSVSKISTMFPTVSETHIRLLLKKYYNREAVVISALQVEKYPITTPGPFTTPPPSRNLPPGTTHVPLHMTPPPGVRNATARGASPIAGRQAVPIHSPLITIGDNRNYNSPKPHHSPKMKLRYMKNVFPKVEETILLEVLGNNENNVQKASEALKEMGFEKRDMKITKSKSSKNDASKSVELPVKVVAPPKLLTLDEKKEMKAELQQKYKDIPERVLVIALESVDYIKERAIQILEIMVQEEISKISPDSTLKKEERQIDEPTSTATTSDILKKSKSSLITPSPSVHFIQKSEGKVRRSKEKKTNIREQCQDNIENDADSYQSNYLVRASGANAKLVKGSDNGMLLEDYVSWDGPDPTLREGNKLAMAKGSNRSLLMSRTYQPCGPNVENRKGPVRALAKGSIYTQLKNAFIGESRGK